MEFNPKRFIEDLLSSPKTFGVVPSGVSYDYEEAYMEWLGVNNIDKKRFICRISKTQHGVYKVLFEVTRMIAPGEEDDCRIHLIRQAFMCGVCPLITTS